MMIRRLLSNQKGSIIVLSTVMLTLALALAGLTVDIGDMYWQRARLQNAVDAAALGGGSKLPSVSAATNTAVTDANANYSGFTAANVSITNGNNRIAVTRTVNISPYFLQAFGVNSVPVTVRAVAERQGASPVFDYAIFSGSQTTTLVFNGGGWDVKGSVHTNDQLILNGGGSKITGAAEAVDGNPPILENGGGNSIGAKVPNSSVMDMPDYTNEVKAVAEAAGQVYQTGQTFQTGGQTLPSAMYVKGNVNINGGGWTGKGAIMADGNITINGGGVTMAQGNSVCYYSRNGNITFNGGGGVFNGILYAPNGRITINGGGNFYNGSVVAKELVFNGGGDHFVRDGHPPDSLPVSSGVKLIE